MEHYVTLFDKLFLPQGLALHLSLARNAKSYRLWILCMDDVVFDFFTQLNDPAVRLLRLEDVETEALLRVKADRAINEYCWTLTPFTYRFVFDADASVERVTYLDADLWFNRNPQIILTEFDESGKQSLITEHAYAPECDREDGSGTYCVQFMTFTRDKGEKVRQWWESKCIEWCFARFEDGKFGDQKYLDDWLERFPEEVHVLQQKGFAMAPWNATRFPYKESVFWHFQALRIMKEGTGYLADYGSYYFPKPVLDNIYKPYLEDLKCAVKMMQESGIEVQAQGSRGLLRKLKAVLTGVQGKL